MTLLIVGFDPGKTFSLCLIDAISGKIILLYSDKNKNIDFIIKKIFQYGTPIYLGFDKKNISSSIKKISRRLKINIINPDEDLKIEKKRKLIRGYTDLSINNKHELDALASAIYAYKRINPIINKLRNKIKDENKLEEILFMLSKKKIKNIKESFVL
ncbi:MAG: DUF460 domain-containing protein [Candidatus Pacearchaeota archaeon]